MDSNALKEEITNTNSIANKNENDFQYFNKLKEEDVGISEYINTNSIGFTCVLKHRYTDFLVNEIDMEGKVVWVKTPQIEEKPKEKTSSEPSSKEEVELLVEENFGGEKAIITSQEDLASLKVFLFNCLNQDSSNEQNEKPLFIGFIDDKNLRKSFHEKIRELFKLLEGTKQGNWVGKLVGQLLGTINIYTHTHTGFKDASFICCFCGAKSDFVSLSKN